MPADNLKLPPCNSCRWRKVKCVKDDGNQSCTECLKRGTVCTYSSSSVAANSTPCEECKKAHVACDWSGLGPCARCDHLRQACTYSAPGPSIPPANPTEGAPSSGSPDGSLSSRKPYFDIVLNKS